MPLPTFIVIGASRSGTTSLQDFFGQHPQISICRVKSPNHFVSGDAPPAREGAALRAMAKRWIADRAAYEALFEAGAPAIGEVSPVYLQSRPAARRIREACGPIRLIAILRHPVERAFAHFLGRRRDGLESRPDFREVVDDELSRPFPEEVAFGSYLAISRYHHFLEPYFELFPAERLSICLFEDLETDPGALLSRLFEFLEVDPRAKIDTSRRLNRSGIVRGWIRRLLWTRSVRLRTALRPLLPGRIRDAAGSPFLRDVSKPELDPELRARLARLFRPDVDKLEERIGRDLSRWRQ